MKSKSDNPIVVVILLAILIGSIVMIVRTLVAAAKANAPQTAAAASASADPDQTTDAGSETDGDAPRGPRPHYTHDPFSDTAMIGLATRPNRVESPTELPAGLRLPAVGHSNDAPDNPIVVPDLTAEPIDFPDKSPATPVSTSPPTTWRVTAIFGGTSRSAILEGAGAQPMTVAVGDKVQDFTVTAVTEHEIVMNNKSGVYTIPLATPSDMANQNANTSLSDGGALDALPKL